MSSDYRPKQLPDWFDLDRYDVCLTWSADTWSRVLSGRAWMLEVARDGWQHRSIKVEWDFRPEDYKRAAAAMLERPLEEESEWEGRRSRKPAKRTVSPLSLEEAFFIYEDWQDAINGREDAICSREEAEAIGGYFHSSGEKKEFFGDSYDERRYMPIANPQGGAMSLGWAYLAVDPGAPDDLLIEHFKQCLAEVREKLNWPTRPQRFTSTDFADWHKLRLLPYLDLVLWSEITGDALTYSVIGVSLFPGEYDVALGDRVRRTVKPRAEALISQRVLNVLEAQSGAEQETA